MHVSPGRLRQMVAEARGEAGYIICHSTLPYAGSPIPPAICRGDAWNVGVAVRAIEVELLATATGPHDRSGAPSSGRG
jgi:hypothetical protein